MYDQSGKGTQNFIYVYWWNLFLYGYDKQLVRPIQVTTVQTGHYPIPGTFIFSASDGYFLVCYYADPRASYMEIITIEWQGNCPGFIFKIYCSSISPDVSNGGRDEVESI